MTSSCFCWLSSLREDPLFLLGESRLSRFLGRRRVRVRELDPGCEYRTRFRVRFRGTCFQSGTSGGLDPRLLDPIESRGRVVDLFSELRELCRPEVGAFQSDQLVRFLEFFDFLRAFFELFVRCDLGGVFRSASLPCK